MSAVPEADPELAHRKRQIELRSAEIPSLLNLPPGCTFHPRCPYFVPGECDTQRPSLETLAERRTCGLPRAQRGTSGIVGIEKAQHGHQHPAGFNIGMFFGVISGLLLIFQEPGTAEFIITCVHCNHRPYHRSARDSRQQTDGTVSRSRLVISHFSFVICGDEPVEQQKMSNYR
ncbi:MAG: hypothetical protein R3A10_09110 [Caldilineaceae bacterium]